LKPQSPRSQKIGLRLPRRQLLPADGKKQPPCLTVLNVTVTVLFMTTDKSNEVTITSRLANKNILITGVATAQEFDKQGARVAICGLNEGTLGFFAYPRKKVQSRITPPKRARFRSGFQPIPERFRPHPQALAVYGIRSVRID
jgi:hypothetical protein